jgi:hypothetical protein
LPDAYLQTGPVLLNCPSFVSWLFKGSLPCYFTRVLCTFYNLLFPVFLYVKWIIPSHLTTWYKVQNDTQKTKSSYKYILFTNSTNIHCWAKNTYYVLDSQILFLSWGLQWWTSPRDHYQEAALARYRICLVCSFLSSTPAQCSTSGKQLTHLRNTWNSTLHSTAIRIFLLWTVNI